MLLIHLFVVLGVAVVLPLSIGRWRAWVAAAAGVAVSYTLGRGALAGSLVLPAVVIAAAILVGRVRGSSPLLFWRVDDLVGALAALWAAVAMGSLAVSRLGLTPLGQREPIIELTAVHYTYAGAAALVLASRTGRVAPVVVTALAPPLVALGFLTGWMAPQVGGAVVMTIGVWLTASLQLREVLSGRITGVPRLLLAISGLAIWLPMVLAVAWALGQHVSIPILSIPDMARTHGAANALGFVLCGLLARRARARSLVAA